MNRRLLNGLTLLSLLLFVAVCAQWVRSHLSDRLWLRWTDGRAVLVGADHPAARNLGPAYLDDVPDRRFGVQELLVRVRAGRPPYVNSRSVNPAAPTHWSVLGVEWFRFSETSRQFWVVTVPAAYLALLTAAAPAWWLVAKLRRRRRDRAGHCPTCGYDMRATPGRCPECGTGVGTGGETGSGTANSAA